MQRFSLYSPLVVLPFGSQNVGSDKNTINFTTWNSFGFFNIAHRGNNVLQKESFESSQPHHAWKFLPWPLYNITRKDVFGTQQALLQRFCIGDKTDIAIFIYGMFT
jgi:hypothetical protein